MKLAPKEIYERLKAKFPEAVTEIVEGPGDAFCVVAKDSLLDVASHLKNDPDLAFDYPACISGTDDLTHLWVVVHLYSVKRTHRAVVKVKLDRENPEVASLCGLWPGANWHEREAYDMYGIRFDGHPDLRRILLPEDWPGYPLRKDYDFPDHYQGIPLK